MIILGSLLRETKTMSKANILNVRLYWKKKKTFFCFNFHRSAFSLHHFEKLVPFKKRWKFRRFRYFFGDFFLPVSLFYMWQIKPAACKKVWQLIQKLAGWKYASEVKIFPVKAAITCRSLAKMNFALYRYTMYTWVEHQRTSAN